MNAAPLRRLVRIRRDFGVIVVLRVAYSKIRGKLVPASALPPPPDYAGARREVSILLDGAAHDTDLIGAIVDIVTRRDGAGWEVCIRARAPLLPEMARMLARLRGTQPWLRIVMAEATIDDGTAARWTVEQATGEFVAILGRGWRPNAESIASLVARLRNDPSRDTAVLDAAAAGSTECRLLLQRKTAYLMKAAPSWPLTAPALADMLAGRPMPAACVADDDRRPDAINSPVG